MDILISYLFSSFIFLLILGLVVLIHELGHFVAAKLIGAKVEEFAFGFGPSIWKKQHGETLYKWNWYPLGGYCKILGEGEEINDPRSFSGKNPLQKIFVLVAGVSMNFILAIIVFAIFFALNSWSIRLDTSPDSPDYKFIGAETKLEIIAVGDNTPASKANLPLNGTIVKLAGKELSSYRSLVDQVNANFGKEVALEIKLNNEVKEYKVNLDTKNEAGRAIVGVGINYTIDYSKNKPLVGVYHAYDTVVYNILGLGHIYNKSVNDGNLNYAAESSGSIAKIAQITHLLVKNDNWVGVLYWIGLISASLSFMNLIPLLPLDGGHIFFVILEFITRRKINDNVKGIFATIGFFFFILLFVVLFVKDIRDFSVVKYLLSLVGIK